MTRRVAKILVKARGFGKGKYRICEGIAERGYLTMQVFREMVCAPIRVFIPIWYTAKGPLCRYNARLPCNLVEACTGNEEVHWCPGGKVILICLCIRMWLFSRGGYPYRCTPHH